MSINSKLPDAAEYVERAGRIQTFGVMIAAEQAGARAQAEQYAVALGLDVGTLFAQPPDKVVAAMQAELEKAREEVAVGQSIDADVEADRAAATEKATSRKRGRSKARAAKDAERASEAQEDPAEGDSDGDDKA